MNERKVFFVGLAMMVLAGVVYASGNREKTPGDVTIQVAYPVAVDAPISDILDRYAREFEAKNPGVTIEPVYAGGYPDIRTMIQTTMDGGGSPPALSVLLATDLFDLANARYIEPITDLIQAMPDGQAYLEDFIPVFLSNSYYMDEIWSLPFQRSAVMLYYNADLLEEAGIEAPSNWAELAEAAQALTVRQNGEVLRWGIEWPSSWPYWLFQPLAMGAGQNIVGEGDAEVFFDHPDVIAAIEYYNSLSDRYQATPRGVQASWGNVVPGFVAGDSAMIVHTSGSLARILSQADFSVGVTGIPGRDGGQFSVPGGGNLYITRGIPEAQRQAAFDFAVFLTEPDRVADFSIATGYIAHRNSAFETPALGEYIRQHPQAGEARQILATAGKELSLQNLGEVRNIFHNYLEAAFNRQMTPAEAMREAQREADAALRDFR
ncbi:sn-glycerol 3-phosphate transport system substrate-binding protein [Alkalispirochaeta americana]|uniref:sn-glycerol 3-phosphate transport system substrate-binding protein n=1 Tax=Alkalispirochaeta americana TaxID=159291 RepID=A0A1N6NJA0_9SPIO|nr:ABC transporter substrate-binding protein [Alkalispirochaeta americana]SIP92123.1 sn-glycerol 3-phosphate transport system substrate-binding protein [Alkalispirochaeta americana]